MSEFGPQITSAELAHHIGYAEKPYVELAQHAFKLGMMEQQSEMLALAQKAGLQEARLYLAAVKSDIDKYAPGVKVEERVSFVATKLDFEEFGSNSKFSKGMPTVVWNVLCREKDHIFDEDAVTMTREGGVNALRLDAETIVKARDLRPMGPIKMLFLNEFIASQLETDLDET